MTDLSKKLSMDHLQKTDAELRQEVLEREEVAEPSEEPKPVQKKDPRHQRTYSFPYTYTNGRGEVFKAFFTNHILNILDKQNVGILESQFNGGQPYDSINDITAATNRAIAWMIVSLRGRENQSPKGWADNLRAQDDENLVLALFQEVNAHEAYFHGHGEDQGKSEGA